MERFLVFSTLDGIAVAGIFLAWLAMGYAVEHGLGGARSVSQIMAGYRRAWFRTMVSREPRILDGAVLASLRQSTTFFASASMIALGGGLALIGNTDQLLGLAEDLQIAEGAPALIWEVKLLLILVFLASAFLKFVWSNRLFGYCAVVMAAVPNDTSDTAYARAAQAAELNIAAARSFNRGLRSVYFAMAAAAWLLGPWALGAATVVTMAVLARREFASHSRNVLMEDRPA